MIVALSILALVASAAVIGAYLFSVKTGNTVPVHWANALGAPSIALSAALAGAWASVPLSVMFGIVGAYGLWNDRKKRRNDKRIQHLQ